MSENEELKELVDAIIERGPPYDGSERLLLAVFGPGVPEWEGVAIPKLDVFKRFLRAMELSQELFGNSDRFEFMRHDPEPFQDYCGLSVYVKAESTKVVYAGFFDEVSAKTAHELISLVDSVMVDAEVSSTGEPILCLSWYINDPFLGKDS